MRIISVFLLTIGLLFNCTSEELNYTVTETDGVRYVHNLYPKNQDNPKLELEFIQKIGGMDQEDENYQFFRMTQVTKDYFGNIYILDEENKRVQVFDKNGKYIRTIGRSGKGPGEFDRPASIGFYDQDKFFVSDRGNMRITTFDLDGKLLKEVHINSWSIYSLLLSSGETIIQKSSDFRISDDETERNTLLSRLDQNGELIKKFGYVKKNNGVFENYSHNVVNMAKDDNDNIYLSFWYDNRFEKYDSGGNLIIQFDRETEFVPAEVRMGMSISAVKFSGSIGVDDQGRIWTKMSRRQKREGEDLYDLIQATDVYDLEIYSPDGVFLQKISPDFPMTRVNFVGDRIFVSSFADMSVSEYKIIDN